VPSPPARSRTVALAVPLPLVPARAADFLELTKPRLNLLVVATTLAGYYLGAGSFDPALLASTVVGTGLVTMVVVIVRTGTGVVGTGIPVLTGCPVIAGFTTSAMMRIITTAATPYMMSFLSIALLKILNIFT
jgi:hypothetical protein